MCGIAGIVHRSGPVDRASLARGAMALAHRGPDGSGIFTDATVGLAHTRLAIIDLEGGRQPLSNADQSLTLVANGEIYNHVELRAELEMRGYRFATHSDCEVLLHGYDAYGLEFLQRVEGMFAFALYDKRQERVILVRDRLGIKPLFLVVNEQGVCFASELKALFQITGRAPEVEPGALVQFLQNSFVSGRRTVARGIERVLPAEAVVIVGGRIESRRRYWSAAGVEPLEMDFEEGAQRFDALMDEVVRKHLRSDVPVGLFLSGGVDSGTLLALMRRHGGEAPQAFSVGFPGTAAVNEVEGAARLAARFGARHEVLEVRREAVFGRLVHTVWAADDLMGDPASLPVSLMSESAARRTKVVFSGEGGDEVFAGYARYRKHPLQMWLKAIQVKGSGGFRTSQTFAPKWQRALFSGTLREVRDQWNAAFVAHWQEAHAGWSALQRMQHVDIATWLADDLLVKADRMTMAWGLEGRVPFLDHRVVEFGLALPDRLKRDRRTGKLFLRRWAERLLPRDHLWGRKSGFTVPVGEWLRGPLLDALERVLPTLPAIEQWLRPEGVHRLCEEQRRGAHNEQLLWRLLVFCLWHRIFVEGEGERPPAFIDPVAFLTAGSAPSGSGVTAEVAV